MSSYKLPRVDTFSKNLADANGLDLQQWVFYQGMMFNDQEQWWDSGERGSRHEGVDFRCYQDSQGVEHNLDGGIKIPAVLDGVVIKVEKDFLGQSIYVCTDVRIKDGFLMAIYGHTETKLISGEEVKEGGVIATVADSKKVPSHLHLTFAVVAGSFTYQALNWNTISERRGINLIDPLEIITERYLKHHQ